jgi:Ca2+-binding RTX toxin-like protein
VGQNGKDVLNGGAISDLLVGGNGRISLTAGSAATSCAAARGRTRFTTPSVSGHGTDWIQDFANTDELFLAVSGVTQNDFALNFAETPGSGQDGVAEAFVGLKTTGQTLFALVDGERPVVDHGADPVGGHFRPAGLTSATSFAPGAL